MTSRADDRYLGTLIDGKYRVDSFISAGGMGSVYRAVHVMLDKTVAVKVIKSNLITTDDVVERFQREARAASNLHHPNIVSVYDLGRLPDGRLYIAMEFVDGPSLKESIRQTGPLPPHESIDIVRQVAGALAAAHRKRIVHRDLKSDNLMLATVDGHRVVKLVDFGIAKSFDDSAELTMVGYMVGTPQYMSPEQAAGGLVDHRADLYSLGVILYETLTGDVPFGDAGLGTVLARLANEVPQPPSIRRPDRYIPPALDAVAMRCLEKEPDRRFQSADEFTEALDRAAAEIAGTSTVVRPSTPTVQPTIVRPAEQPSVGPLPPDTRPHAAGTRSPHTAPRHRRLAVAVLAFGGVTAIAAGVALFDGAESPNGSTQTIANPAEVSAPASLPAATEEPSATAPEQVAPAAADTSPEAASVRSPAQTGGVRSPATQESAPAATAPVTAPRPSPPAESPVAGSQAAPPTAPDPPPVATAAVPARPARIAPPVFLACQGFGDVCAVVRAELVRALDADGVPVVSNQDAAGIQMTAAVGLVSETRTTQFGTPTTVRTYSIELTARSNGKMLSMPPPHIFEFEPIFGRTRLQENARVIAVGAAEAVRTFTAGN